MRHSGQDQKAAGGPLWYPGLNYKEPAGGRDIISVLRARIVNTASHSLLTRIAEECGVAQRTPDVPSRDELVDAILDAPALVSRATRTKSA